MKIKKILKFAWLPKIIDGKIIFFKYYVVIKQERQVKHIIHNMGNTKWLTTYEWDTVKRVPLKYEKLL